MAASSPHLGAYAACDAAIHGVRARLLSGPDGVIDPLKLVQLDHKWKLASVEAEAAEELRRSLGITQKVSQRRKKLN